MHEASLLLAVLLAIQVVISDLYARRVANRALALTLLAATASMLLLPGLSTAPAAALLGLLLGLLSLLPFYALRWMGAGDVKLFAVLGFVLGWHYLLPVWVIASLMAGVHAVAVIASRRLRPSLAMICGGIPLKTLQRLEDSSWHQRALSARQGRQGIPYAAYLGAAVLLLAVSGVSYG